MDVPAWKEQERVPRPMWRASPNTTQRQPPDTPLTMPSLAPSLLASLFSFLQVAICLPTGDLYLESQGINPDHLWMNIGILAAMIPVYLGIAYVFLRSLKKKS